MTFIVNNYRAEIVNLYSRIISRVQDSVALNNRQGAVLPGAFER